MIWYTDRLIPARFDGYTIGPLILIRPAYRNDAGLHAHERVHVNQFWRTFGLHGLLYTVSRRYRLAAEIEAYRAQLTHSPQCRDLYAGYIATRYNLALSPSQAAAIAAML